MTTISDATTVRSLRRIGLWGAPGSGKTTFLAALNVAVMQASADLLIFGADDEATEFLASNTSLLMKHRRFPSATEDNRPLSWTLHMPIQRTVAGRFGRLSRPVSQPVTLQFNIDLLDAPGGYYAAMPEAASADDPELFGGDYDVPSDPEEVIEHLAGCDGIIYLFDPVRESTAGDTFEYFQGTLLRIAQRRLGAGMRVAAKLPQHLAVCVTKLDAPPVYKRAQRGGYLTFDENDPYLFPRLREDRAADFFAELCQSAAAGTAELVPRAINRYFAPGRVKHFGTSAIGFYLRPGARRFVAHDYQNARRDADGSFHIRGRIRPINVVEPLVWLGERLAATDSRA